jgi:hypothetical protein
MHATHDYILAQVPTYYEFFMLFLLAFISRMPAFRLL